MKVKYVHSSDPEVEKIYDTKKSLEGCIGLIHSLGSDRTLAEWDKHELMCFERDKAKGLVLSYSIVEGGDDIASEQ